MLVNLQRIFKKTVLLEAEKDDSVVVSIGTQSPELGFFAYHNFYWKKYL